MAVLNPIKYIKAILQLQILLYSCFNKYVFDNGKSLRLQYGGNQPYFEISIYIYLYLYLYIFNEFSSEQLGINSV